MLPSEAVTQPDRKCDLILPLSPWFRRLLLNENKNGLKADFPKNYMLFCSRKQPKEPEAAEDEILQMPAPAPCGHRREGGEGGFSPHSATSAPVDSPGVRPLQLKSGYVLDFSADRLAREASSFSSSGSERESAGELSPTCVFPSFACDFLAGDGSFDCCSLDPLTGSYLPCRRSPRLLTNGYYIWTEDSFLCDGDGNITLSPSQTSVMYRENSVRIFRKKKRIRRSFPSLLRLGAPRSWLRGNIFADADSAPGEASWLEGASSPDAQPCGDSGGDFDCVLTDDWASERLEAESMAASSPGHVPPETPGEDSLRGALQPRGTAAEHLQGDILDHSKTSLLEEISFQTVLLAACLAMSACARWLLGGLVAGVFTCSLTIMIAYVVKSLLLSLASYFNAGPCARFAKI